MLFSGITSAISSFMQEIKDQSMFGIEIMESQGLSITSQKGEHSSLVLVSSLKLPMLLLNQMIKVHT